MFMRRIMLGGIVLAAVSSLAAPVKEWEAREEDAPVSGKQAVSVRFAPGETADYDQLVFDCRLRQEFAKLDSSGQMRRRVIEPVDFTYREDHVRMVADLDKHISFWVPVSYEEVARAFGEQTFVADAPIHVSRIKVTALREGHPVWTLEGEVGRRHRVAPATPPPPAPAAPKPGTAP